MQKTLLLMAILFVMGFNIMGQPGGYALKFDGTNDYVNCGSGSAFHITGNQITIEAWIYTDNINQTWQKVAGKQTGDVGIYSLVIESNTKKPALWLRIGTTGGSIQGWGRRVIANTALEQDKWYHIAATYDGTTASIYINGKLDNSTPCTGDINADSSIPFYIGKNNISAHFNGRIDEVRLWDVGRTADQIRANMYKEIGTHTNLKAYYKMSDGSGTSLTDNSGNDNTGTLTNGPIWKVSGCFAGSRLALDFDGINDQVNIPGNASLGFPGNSTFSFETWISPTAKTGGGSAPIMERRGVNGNAEYVLLYNYTNHKITFGIGKQSFAWQWLIQDAPREISLDQWTHIAIVKAGETVILYINGYAIQTATLNNTSLSATSSNHPFNIGGGGFGYFKGKFDDVRIWSKALTDSEIRENMMKSLLGSESNLVGYYRMDEADGIAVYDASPLLNHASMSHMDIAAARISSSAYNTWLGGESSAWSNVANWSNGVPAAAQSIGLYKWNLANITTHDAIITGNPVMNNLLISSGSAPTLSSGVTINGSLLLEKNMSLNGQTITLGPSGYLVEGTGNFSGATGMITTTRPLNNITGQNVAGLGATLTSAANLGSTTLTRTHSNQNNLPDGKSVLRSYDITPTTNTGLNATLVYSYRDAELNGFLEANIGLYSSADGGSIYTYRGGVLDANNNTITLTGLNSFSKWTAGINCYNPTNGGTIGTSQTICSGASPAILTQTAAPGGSPVGTLQYKWQTSTTSSSAGFTDITGATAISYQPGSLTQTTWYKRLVKVDCESAWMESDVAEVAVIPLLQYRTIQSGNWTTLANWQQYNGTNWVAATSYPGQISNSCASPMVNIQANHQMEIPNGIIIIIPNLKVESGAKSIVKPGGKLDVRIQLQLDKQSGAAIVVE